MMWAKYRKKNMRREILYTEEKEYKKKNDKEKRRLKNF